MPLGGAEGKGAFAEAPGDGAQRFLAGGDDEGQDHEGEGEPASHEGDVPFQGDDEKADTEEAEDDGGNAGEIEDGEPDGVDERAVLAVFAEVNGAEDAEDEGDGHGADDEKDGADNLRPDTAGGVAVGFVVGDVV